MVYNMIEKLFKRKKKPEDEDFKDDVNDTSDDTKSKGINTECR